ncbi:hypothetical protein KFE25_002308 [Diacronema lutheri]|uniref:Sel1 repeat family protein n=1 Tax=Diacronema lutheri TaxID=2081491 RepID=A0A8J6C1K5_DIALT|nr:hypothetical protein KFE25_002308 [Diacronema lutheri]
MADGDDGDDALRARAEAGDVDAMSALGELVAKRPGGQSVWAEAARWWRVAAERGHADAQFHLAIFCLQGKGVRQDDREAERWCRQSAAQGHARAQQQLQAMLEQAEEDRTH